MNDRDARIDAASTIDERDRDGLPQLFRMFAGEVKSALEFIATDIKTVIAHLQRIEGVVIDHGRRIATLEQSSDKHGRQLVGHDERLAALESRTRKARK